MATSKPTRSTEAEQPVPPPAARKASSSREPGDRRATSNLTDVAREAGCSKMTVSRVLRNDRHVKQATKELVLRTIERLGYKPNPMVVALMQHMRHSLVKKGVGVLAYLVSGPTRDHWRSLPTYCRFFEGAARSADRHGYKLEIFWLNDPGVSQKRLSQILYAQGICGVIVGPMSSAHGHLNLDWEKFCSVAIGYSLMKPFLPRVSNDQYRSTLLAFRKLHQLGYRKIGMAVTPRYDMRVHYNWSAAYLSFRHRHPIENSAALMMEGEWSRKRALAWIRKTRPEVIVSIHKDLLGWLKEEGYRLPQDIGYVDLDWSDLSGPCAGIDQRSDAVGSAALDLAVSQINRNDYGLPTDAPSLLLPGVWVDGPTVRQLPR